MMRTEDHLPSLKILLSIFLGIIILQAAVDFFIADKSIIAALVIDEIVIILFLPLAVLKITGFNITAILPLKKTGSMTMLVVVCLTIGAAVLLSYLRSVSSNLIPVPEILLGRQMHSMAIHSWGDFYFKLLVICAVAPFCEEVFFRGLIQNKLESKYGSGIAIMLTSILFALAHSASFEPHLYLLLGLLFSWIFSVTRTIRTTIICHAVNNAWVFVNQIRGQHFPFGEKMEDIDILMLATSGLIVVAAMMWTMRFGARRAKEKR